MQKSRMKTRSLALVPGLCAIAIVRRAASSAGERARQKRRGRGRRQAAGRQQGGVLRRFPRADCCELRTRLRVVRTVGQEADRSRWPPSGERQRRSLCIGACNSGHSRNGKELRRPRRAVFDRELPRLHDRGAGQRGVCLYQAPAGEFTGVERGNMELRGVHPDHRASTWACASPETICCTPRIGSTSCVR